MKRILTGISFFFVSILCIISIIYAQEDAHESSTDISSDKMTYTGQNNLIVFSGNVHVVRPDFQLWSRELHVFLKPGQSMEPADQQENIEKILAMGDVLIQSGSRKGYSDLLTYLPDTGEARLEGNPRLEEHQNSIEGETIILNMSKNTSEVLGGPDKRVRVIFHTDSEDQE